MEESKDSIDSKVNKIFNPSQSDDINANQDHVSKIVRYNISMINVLNELGTFYKWF